MRLAVARTRADYERTMMA
jgi:hypothetical protein